MSPILRATDIGKGKEGHGSTTDVNWTALGLAMKQLKPAQRRLG